MGRPQFQLVSPEPSEHRLQIDCTKMLAAILLPEVCWTAIDHAHSLDRRLTTGGVPVGLVEMRKRKARGVRSGIWDYFFWHRSLTHVIELKVGDNDLSDDQELFGRQLIRAGVKHLKVCWNKDQVFDTVVAWGLTRNAVMA
ncbi:MAG: VRR-NUC domain-containing protein [Alphaproteobacteria bacterium]|nr:VRR-NUC domain-containing protein [Alphaproteobacteria bacterium]